MTFPSSDLISIFLLHFWNIFSGSDKDIHSKECLQSILYAQKVHQKACNMKNHRYRILLFNRKSKNEKH